MCGAACGSKSRGKNDNQMKKELEDKLAATEIDIKKLEQEMTVIDEQLEDWNKMNIPPVEDINTAMRKRIGLKQNLEMQISTRESLNRKLADLEKLRVKESLQKDPETGKLQKGAGTDKKNTQQIAEVPKMHQVPDQGKYKSALNSEAVRLKIQFEEADKNIIGQPPRTRDEK